jgi:iron complex transport system substrate-binding protein
MKKVFFIFVLLIGTLISCSCGTRGNTTQDVRGNFAIENTNAHYPVTISNYNSKKEKVTITFKKAPEKVFALHQNSIETLLALGLEDRIVACAGDIPPIFKSDDYEYHEGFRKANYMSDKNPSLEDLLVMNLDFILGWHSSFLDKSLGTTDFWQERGTNAYIAENSNDILLKKTVDTECRYILDIGKIFDREEKANGIVKQMEEEIKKVAELSGQKKKQKTMVIELNNNKITVYGQNQLAGDMVTRLGAELIHCNDHVNYEELIKLDPEVIFIAYMGDDGQKYVEQFLQTESLASISCVKNKRVYAIPLTYMYASATRTFAGIQVFAKGLYPES